MQTSLLLPILLSLLLPLSSKGTSLDPALASVYENRKDLQACFDPSGNPLPHGKAGFLLNLEDWARQYGWREDTTLSAYAPTGPIPELKGKTNLPKVTATSLLILDRRTGLILAGENADRIWPIASLSKLMTSDIVFQEEVDLGKVVPIEEEDEVGGARLAVSAGTTFTVEGLLYAALVGSANNAATALSHATDLSQEAFIQTMNERAKEMGLSKTHFSDPSGMNPANVSTAREMAKLAEEAFEQKEIRRYTSTATRTIEVLSPPSTKKLTNTNWMVWKPEYDDVYVTAGKTGYLEESGWNLVVSLRPNGSDTTRELLLVLFGSQSRPDSFKDAKALAQWVWKNFEWNEAF